MWKRGRQCLPVPMDRRSRKSRSARRREAQSRPSSRSYGEDWSRCRNYVDDVQVRIQSQTAVNSKTNIINRGSIAPVIAVAWYQSTDIAEIYTTLGYLVPYHHRPIYTDYAPGQIRTNFDSEHTWNLHWICDGLTRYLDWSQGSRAHNTRRFEGSANNSSQAAVCAICSLQIYTSSTS